MRLFSTAVARIAGESRGHEQLWDGGLRLVVMKWDPNVSREEGALHSVVPADRPGEPA